MITYENNTLKVSLGNYLVDIGYDIPLFIGSNKFNRLWGTPNPMLFK